jgi:hypothetical protein
VLVLYVLGSFASAESTTLYCLCPGQQLTGKSLHAIGESEDWQRAATSFVAPRIPRIDFSTFRVQGYLYRSTMVVIFRHIDSERRFMRRYLIKHFHQRHSVSGPPTHNTPSAANAKSSRKCKNVTESARLMLSSLCHTKIGHKISLQPLCFDPAPLGFGTFSYAFGLLRLPFPLPWSWEWSCPWSWS